ncbi:MAG: hypothetical protein IIZ48_06985 [Erysipelotrichales bacterium]|nr:hypothetical protein [Erysipelotrichales bacterium]
MKSMIIGLGSVMFGGAISAAALLAWLMCIGCVAGIIKVLSSSSGKLTINGMVFQWQK